MQFKLSQGYFPEVKVIHNQTDNIVALTYLIKMGETKSNSLSILSKEIWEYLIKHGITITAEHLPGKQNLETNSQSVHDSSEWKLNPKIFINQLCLLRGTPEIDLYAATLGSKIHVLEIGPTQLRK